MSGKSVDMMIWIDVVNGVGKSHVAAELEKLFAGKNAEYVESDIYWLDFLQKNTAKAFSGFYPYLINFLWEYLGWL